MFFVNLKKDKIFLTVLLSMFIFVSSFIPISTRADVIVSDPAQTAINAAGWLERAANWASDNAKWLADQALKIAMAQLLRQMTLEIVRWIDSGFQGNPAFITNTSQFLKNTVDITIGDMLMGSSLAFLCDPFKLQLKLSLGLQYRPFQDQIRCRFTTAVGNATDAMNKFTKGDFIGGGGWDSWLQITTQPQNNQMGAMVLAQAELDARIVGSKDIAVKEADWGGGFMSWKECTPAPTVVSGEVEDPTVATGDSVYTEASTGGRADYYNGAGDVAGTVQENQDCTIQTPGSVISNKINWADSSDLRKTELANDINAIASALFAQLVKQLSDGLLKRGTGSTRSSSAYQDNQAYLSSLQAQISTIPGSTPGITPGTSPGTIPGRTTPGANEFTQPVFSGTATLDSINSYINIEQTYSDNQSNINSLLTVTSNIFGSSTCNSITKNEIIGQIEGNINYDKTVLGNLVWNKPDIQQAFLGAVNNITALQTAKTAVTTANSNAQIQTAIQPLQTISFDTSASANSYASPDGDIFKQIITWVNSKIQGNISCAGNISSLSPWGIL